jgi:hypothetical protein
MKVKSFPRPSRVSVSKDYESFGILLKDFIDILQKTLSSVSSEELDSSKNNEVKVIISLYENQLFVVNDIIIENDNLTIRVVPDF